ncbi:MAG TPA: hypothetical protein PLY91_03495 [Methanoregulaceae archaeon]|nr:hypothetical protein [Methanoregulaceae archaeon]
MPDGSQLAITDSPPSPFQISTRAFQFSCITVLNPLFRVVSPDGSPSHAPTGAGDVDEPSGRLPRTTRLFRGSGSPPRWEIVIAPDSPVISIVAAGIFVGVGAERVVAEMRPAATTKMPISITTPRISAFAFSFFDDRPVIKRII